MVERQAWLATIGLLLASTMTAGVSHAAVTIQSRAIAVQTTGSTVLALSVTGTGFGVPAPGSALLVDAEQRGTRLTLRVDSNDPRVVIWKDVHVVVTLPADMSEARVAVVTPTGRSRQVRTEYWTHDGFDTTAAGGPNGAPLHIAVDRAGRVWVNPEFKRNPYFFDPTAQQVRAASYPVAIESPFELCVYGCAPSTWASGGEAITIDDRDRVWIPESGGAPGSGAPRNHGRVVMYDPASAEVRLYNLPGDHNGLMGIAWDARRRRIWLAQTNATRPPLTTAANLLSFDPEAVPYERFAWDVTTPAWETPSAFAFRTTATCEGVSDAALGTCSSASHHACASAEDCVLAELFCAPGSLDDTRCYHEYPLDSVELAHVTVHPDGFVWFTDYAVGLGSRIGRLDPSTGRVEFFPLAPVPYEPAAIPLTLFAVNLIAPWDITVARDGSIVATEYGSNRIARFPRRLMLDTTQCRQLSAPGVDPDACQAHYDPATNEITAADPRCANPCIQETLIPGTWEADTSRPPLTHISRGRLLQVAPDRRGRLWFGQGYMDEQSRAHLWPPLLDLSRTSRTQAMEADDLLYAGIGGGVAVDPRTGDVWASDYLGRRLNRLHRTR